MNADYSDQKKRIKDGTQISLSDGPFYEIEYDSTPMKGVGKYVLKAQSIKTPEKDEIRELFHKMRDIKRQTHPSNLNYARFFDRRVQQDNSSIFYKQGVFMKDFEDNYVEEASFSGYFPYYQMLGYEQLRTYFTWRSNVRIGIIQVTSLSYAFLYLYELLNNIGVTSPQDGLEKLISFWSTYKQFDTTIDKYVIRWMKDYHIYYNLTHLFNSFIEEHKLEKYYPKMVDHQNNFELFCSLSKYDITKSAFFTDETSQIIMDCFNDVIDKIRQAFDSAGLRLDDVLFSPTKKINIWRPFKDALFYPWYKQPDRKVVISENEIYLCKNNEWTYSTTITSEVGRQLMGYVMKQMESVLRTELKYKFKLTANSDMVSAEIRNKLEQIGISMDKIVETAVKAFYREATKTVVTVDHNALHRIRQEALFTQEALSVEEQDTKSVSKRTKIESLSTIYSAKQIVQLNQPNQPNKATTPEMDSWTKLKDTLSDKELQALILILQGKSIKQFVDNHNIMLEVLTDAINEKAFDTVGDNILDDEQAIYDDYRDLVKEMVS